MAKVEDLGLHNSFHGNTDVQVRYVYIIVKFIATVIEQCIHQILCAGATGG